jgi:hypothetical protein
LVLVFFLGPDDLCIRILGAFSLHQVVWERRDLKSKDFVRKKLTIEVHVITHLLNS